MNCLPFEERIALYVDGALDRHEVRLVEEHLRSCSACAEFADGLEYDRIGLRTPPPESSEVDYGALRVEIRRAIVRERRTKRLIPALLIAASILIAVGIAAMRMVSGRIPVPQSQIAQVKVGQAVPPATLSKSGADPLVRGRRPRRPDGISPSIDSMGDSGSGGTRADQGVRPTMESVPTADPALEAALREFIAAEEAVPDSLSPVPPIEIRIVTGDPNVILILLQETSGVSNE
jgi:hypothetical protein